ncbi:hypothetical protein IPG37_01265 [bacterium]|nr:MAG: hypothetical protein IPG37_01265 [bacterium]
MYLFLISILLFLSGKDLFSSAQNVEYGLDLGNGNAYLFDKNIQEQPILSKYSMKQYEHTVIIKEDGLPNLPNPTLQEGAITSSIVYYLLPFEATGIQRFFESIETKRAITLSPVKQANKKSVRFFQQYSHPQAKAMITFCKREHKGKPLIDYLWYNPKHTNYKKEPEPRCLVPENYGVYYEDNDLWRKNLWDKYCIQRPERQRLCVERSVIVKKV